MAAVKAEPAMQGSMKRHYLGYRTAYGKILQSRGIPVIYTRDSDVYVSLGERAG